MKKRTKICLIIAAVLCFVGIVIGMVGLVMMTFDLTKLSTENFETATYELKDYFNKIDIDVYTADIEIALSEDEVCRVVCYERARERHRAYIKDRVLILDTVEKTNWYDYIGVAIGKAKVTVYLPKAEYESVSLELSTGDVIISGGFNIKNVEIETDTGDVTLDTCMIEGIDISTDTGDISIKTSEAQNIKIETDTGNINMTHLKCESIETEGGSGYIYVENVTSNQSIYIVNSTGDVSVSRSNAGVLIVRTSTGDVKLTSADADEFIWVKTDTGDISGSLASDKIFEVKSSSGKVSVPQNAGDERCEIVTSTGKVNIIINKTK